MTEFYPLVVIGAVIGVLSLVFITVYYYVRSREEKKEHDRKMSDRELDEVQQMIDRYRKGD